MTEFTILPHAWFEPSWPYRSPCNSSRRPFICKMSKLWVSSCENYWKLWINWYQHCLPTHTERYVFYSKGFFGGARAWGSFRKESKEFPSQLLTHKQKPPCWKSETKVIFPFLLGSLLESESIKNRPSTEFWAWAFYSELIGLLSF